MHSADDTIKPAIVTESHLQALAEKLINASGAYPLSLSYRTLFTLKSLCQRAVRKSTPSSTAASIDPLLALPPNAEETIIETIGKALYAPSVGSLLRHELAYVLGQIGSPLAIRILEEVVNDIEGQEEMIRHESAEALAALDSRSSIEMLRRFVNEGGDGEKGRIVRETCQIALRKLEWNVSEEGKKNGGIDRYVSFHVP